MRNLLAKAKLSLKHKQAWLHNHYDGVKLTIGIITLIILIGGLYAQNQALLRQADQIKAAVDSSNKTSTELRNFTEAVAGAVTDIKTDGKNRTIVLCTLILRSNFDLTQEDAIKVHEICEEEIQRAITGDSGDNADRSSSSPNNSSDNSPSNRQGGTSENNNQPNTPPNEEPEEDDSTDLGNFLQGAGDATCTVITVPVLNIVGDRICR